MESHSVPGRIQVTERVRAALSGRYRFEARGTIDVKGKGSMETYFLLGAAGDQSPEPSVADATRASHDG